MNGATAWGALLVPRGVPDAAAKRLHAAFDAAMRDPEVQAFLRSQGQGGVHNRSTRLGTFGQLGDLGSGGGGSKGFGHKSKNSTVVLFLILAQTQCAANGWFAKQG